MRPRWEDVNARVRGLGTRLLGPESLAELARAPDLPALAAALQARGLLGGEPPVATASALALALRRAAARDVRLIHRWLGSRDELVAVVLDAEDRRSLRALVRGAVAGAAAETRLAGLVPTPRLPERLLRELADRSRVREQAALLVTAGHPAGAPLLAAAGESDPDLFALELALLRTFAERASRGARRAGGLLAEYVGTWIDLENCRTALELTARQGDEPAHTTFLPGGRELELPAFARAAAAATPGDAARILGNALGGGTFALLLRHHAGNLTALERAVQVELTAWLRHHARLDPLGPAPLLLWFHRLAAQAEALGALVWSIDLGVPAERRVARVSAA